MTIFATHSGLRRSGTGNLVYPSTLRIYSLKFYENTTLKVDLVGALRKKDGVTGLYDKISKHFYPAPDMTYGNVVGDLGDKESILESIDKEIIETVVSNASDTRMWRANIPQLTQLEDGQKLNVSTLYAVSNSTQTTELADWDDTTSNSNVYIKVTLADNKTTEWIPAYALSTTRLTTHFATGAPLLLTYRENVFSGATATAAGSMIMRGFFAQPYYNTNNDVAYTLYYMNPIAGIGGLKKYSLFMMTSDGRFSSFTTNDGTGTSKTKNTIGFIPGKIYYHWHSTSHSENGKCGNNCIAEAYGTVDLQYSGNQGATIVAGKPTYLVGTINSDGLFYLDDNWITQSIPTTEDGKIYFYLGLGYNTTSIHFEAVNPAFKYVNGAFRQISVDSITTNGHIVNSDVPANAKFTDTVTTATTTGSGNAVTAITASNGALTVTKGTTFLTSHQDISGKADKATTLAGYGITNAYTKTEVDNLFDELPEPMIFKGSVGTGGTITSLPTATTDNEGWTYKVITALSSPAAKVGDTVISNGSSWVVIPSGDEPSGTVTSVGISNGGGLSVSGSPITSSGTITVSHADTSSQVSSSNSGRTYIQSITLDTYGHVTALSTATETVTNTDTKLKVAEVTSATQYYPLVGTGTTAAERQYDTTGFKYKGTTGTTSAVGSAILELGNSTASGTAGNKQGQLIVYGTNAKKATITLAAPSADIALALPTSGGTLALASQIPTISANTGNSTTGISIAAHGTGTVIGVQSTTTSVRGVKTGTSSLATASHVSGGGNGTAPTLGTAISLIGVQSSTTSVRGVKTGTNSTTTASKVSFGTAFSVPNVTDATDVTVPIRADADVTVPVAASAATTVPIKATSATTVPIKNISATTVPVVSSNADATLSFAMDTTDTKKLKISWSATPTRTVFGTSTSIYGVQSSTTSVTGVQSSTTSVTGVSGSTTVRGVKTGTSSTTTASKVTLGTAFSIPNPSATDVTVPIRADADTTVPIKNTSATSIPNVTSAGTASTWTFEDVDVPIRADADTTVPIKNTSASTFVTGTTHTVTDNGHTHTI